VIPGTTLKPKTGLTLGSILSSISGLSIILQMIFGIFPSGLLGFLAGFISGICAGGGVVLVLYNLRRMKSGI